MSLDRQGKQLCSYEGKWLQRMYTQLFRNAGGRLGVCTEPAEPEDVHLGQADFAWFGSQPALVNSP